MSFDILARSKLSAIHWLPLKHLNSLKNFVRIVSRNFNAHNQRNRHKCLSWPVHISTADDLTDLTGMLSSSINHRQSDSQAEILNKSSWFCFQIKAVWRKMTVSKFSLDCVPYIKAKTITETPNRTVLLCTETYKCDLTTHRKNIRVSNEAWSDKDLPEDNECDEETDMDNNV